MGGAFDVSKPLAGGVRWIPWRWLESDVHSHCFDLIAETGERLTTSDWKGALRAFARVQRVGCEPGVDVLLGCALSAIDQRRERDE